MTIKFGTHTSYDKRTTPIDFQGQGSKVEVTRYTLLLNLVNMIQTEPFQLWPSNLVRTLLMTRRWHLYIFKVMGQRSKINPFYIANYKVIFLFKSPVGRILQRWRCFGIFDKYWHIDNQLKTQYSSPLDHFLVALDEKIVHVNKINILKNILSFKNLLY